MIEALQYMSSSRIHPETCDTVERNVERKIALRKPHRHDAPCQDGTADYVIDVVHLEHVMEYDPARSNNALPTLAPQRPGESCRISCPSPSSCAPPSPCPSRGRGHLVLDVFPRGLGSIKFIKYCNFYRNPRPFHPRRQPEPQLRPLYWAHSSRVVP